ncbi:MAG: hypothetical protein SO127_01320, partial [Muribaculaceae bacterium]|nr:hypothetical protein [Muribaculaceae bacterium]
GAVLKNSNILLEVCIVKGTAATLCHRFAGLSTTKLIRYRNKNKFFSPFSFRFQGFIKGPIEKGGRRGGIAEERGVERRWRYPLLYIIYE